MTDSHTPGERGRRAAHSRSTFPEAAPHRPEQPPHNSGYGSGPRPDSRDPHTAETRTFGTGSPAAPHAGTGQGPASASGPQHAEQTRPIGSANPPAYSSSAPHSGGTAGGAGYGSSRPGYGSGGAGYAAPAAGASAAAHTAPTGSGPTGSGPTAAAPQQPGHSAPAAYRRQRRGPGWGALTAFSLVAALVGAGLGAGGVYAAQELIPGAASTQSSETTEVPLENTVGTPDWTHIAETVSPAVVAIQVGTNGEITGVGSGFVYDDAGHIVTNNHVVAPADTAGGEVSVVFRDGASVSAKIIGRDPDTDVAVLGLEGTPEKLTVLSRGKSADLSVGDPVMALGNPLGLADTVTTGIVSALNRPVSTQNIGDVDQQEVAQTITNAIQTDAAINPGNSGGPLVDGNGRLVGINSSAATLSQPGAAEGQSGSIGIGFAIPVEQATYIADQLISGGEALHPFLGVTMSDSTVKVGSGSRGSAKVSSVEPGSPAETAGLREGDEIVEFDGNPISSGVSLQALVRSTAPGHDVPITVVRGGSQETLTVSLAER